MIRFIILAAFLSSIANAQDVPPPPKPQDDSPSLEVTMKFIQDKLNGQGTVNYVVTPHNGGTNPVSDPRSTSNTMSEADANPASCALSVSEAIVSPEGRRDIRIEFSLRETEKLAVSSWAEALNRRNAEAGHPELIYEFAPSIFSLTVQMLQGKRVRQHEHFTKESQQPTDSDRIGEFVVLFFREEEMAQRVAKAMLHAVELCGGGNKEPF